MFDDFVAFRAGIERGVSVGRLVPFHYFGLVDDIDYANIPWKNHRFDPEHLAREAATETRMRSLWEGWVSRPTRFARHMSRGFAQTTTELCSSLL